MANTALNRTVAALWTNKSGGALAYGDVVILDNTNAKGFTTTTTAGLSTRGLGVIVEPNGIANNATGLVATAGWVPKVTLNTAATVGQFIKTHTVAGQATPHTSPQVEGDFGVALQASATPEAMLFGSANPPVGAAGLVEVIRVVFDGGGSALVANTKARFSVQYNCTVTANRMLADQSGSAVLDIWKDTYANYPPTIADTITASAKPTISSATKSEDTTLTGWTTSWTAGDTFVANVDSCTSITWLALELKVTRT